MRKAPVTKRAPAKPKSAPKKAPPRAATTEVKITAAKGRPMLTWVGKAPLRQVTAFPAQHIETFDPTGAFGRKPADSALWQDWPQGCPRGGLLFYGDNREVMAHLLASGLRGRVKLVYADPPYDSGADYVRPVALRGPVSSTKIDGEQYSLDEQVQYADIWANDNYLQFMYERLLLLREVLAERGSIALHCDARRSHYLRSLMEEVYGADNFRGEIVVRAGVKSIQSQFEEMANLTLGSNSVLLFSRGADTKYAKLQMISADYEPGKWDTFWRGTDRRTMRYELFGQTPHDGQWRWSEDRARAAVANYDMYVSKSAAGATLDDYYLRELEQGRDLDFVRRSDDGVVQYYVSPRKHRLLSNVWLDLPYRGTHTDYPTEKNEAIALRLMEWLTLPGALTLDCFCGSGTVAAVAQKLGRRWIACDINKGAVQTTSKRLQTIIAEQTVAARQGKLLETENNGQSQPAQLGFTVWRVNDYDLQMQHNEAVNLACEHIGVDRMRSDSFFDGTRGKALVKIVPFDHPLSPIDLEEIRRELEARPDEDRNVVAVCLGKEFAADKWLEDWNRLRRGKGAVNRIEAIELRTDPKYGKFFEHKPARAKVTITRKKGRVAVEIEDFISPTILERLEQQAGLVRPTIDDWRAMVDCVMIDRAYDGQAFNVAVSDVPGRKAAWSKGAMTSPRHQARPLSPLRSLTCSARKCWLPPKCRRARGSTTPSGDGRLRCARSRPNWRRSRSRWQRMCVDCSPPAPQRRAAPLPRPKPARSPSKSSTATTTRC